LPFSDCFFAEFADYLSEELVLETVLKMGVQKLGCSCLHRC